MKDSLALLFGYAVILTASALFIWENIANKGKDVEAGWLYTPARYKRRVMMALMLACVGALIVLEAHGLIILSRLRFLFIYILALSGFACALLVLSLRDLTDMARNAEKHAVNELKQALEEQARKEAEAPRQE